MEQVLIGMLLLIFSSNLSASSLEVIQVLPSGEDVAQTRQITFKFNQNVVPLGRMERKKSEISINISPEVNCNWRWIDRSTLACQLKGNTVLNLATKYKIEVLPQFISASGNKLKKKLTHSFITQRPKTGHISFNTWRTPGTPVIRVSFNQPVGEKSIKKALSFKIGEKIVPVKVSPPKNKRRGPRFIWVPGEPYFINFGNQKKQQPNDKSIKKKGENARRNWLIEPTSELPLNTTVSIIETPGLMSAHGREKGIESKNVKNFSTFPLFSFAGIKCKDNSGNQLFIKSNQNRSIDIGKCSPVGGGIGLQFTTPVLKEELRGKINFTPDLTGGRKDFDPWKESYSWSRLRSSHRQGSYYTISLPSHLKAETEYKISDGENIKDEFGRRLETPINFIFKTDMRKPNWTISHRKAVVEKGIGNDVPIYVTNLENVNLNYQGMSAKGSFSEKSKVYKPNSPKNISVGIPMELESILGNKAGAIYGHVGSSPHVQKYNNNFFAQSTNYQLMVKFGHYNTLVWVTDMRSGKSVEGAEVELLRGSYTNLSSLEKILDVKKTNSDGLSSFKGMEQLDPDLRFSRVWKDNETRYFIKIKKDNEMGLLPLDSNFKIDTYRLSESGVYQTLKRKYGHIKSWGVTAQGVYKLGDKVQFKIYVRDQNVMTFKPAPKELYNLKVMDPMNKVAYEKKGVKLNEFGSLDGEFRTSKSSPMGWYQFILSTRFGNTNHTLFPLKVLITDFTPSTFRVESLVNGAKFEPGEDINVDTSAKLHSGGPYVDAESRVTITLKESRFSPTHPVSRKFTFQPYRSFARQRQIFQNSNKVNNRGTASDSYTLKDERIQYGKLYIESAVRDDRGKHVATGKSATYLGVDRFVGLRNTKWTYKSGEKSNIEYLVVDSSGKPMKGIPIDIKIEYKKTSSSRVKGAGNAYISKFTHQMIKEASCKGKSLEAQASCTFKPKEAGQYKITANIKDSKGRSHSSSVWAWVTGKNHVVWESTASNSLNIIPENESYKVGDTAKYLIQNPFPKAQALVTLERYGIIKQWVQDFNTSTPIIKFKITEDLIPGFYLSVTVVSPRVQGPKGLGKLDLGKPTFRIGYVKVPVKDQYKDIIVSSKTDKEVYRPRDKVKVSISAKERFASRGKKTIEVAVAVLDEAVFDLIKGGSSYFDPYWGFYKLDNLDLTNYSLLTRLLGRQKFEKKGANQGGGGAASSAFRMRSIFKFVSYWNPSIKLKNGKANFEFNLPDNLTGWKIITMAVTPEDKMGIGEDSFKVNRKTEIQPATPNQVTEGDEFTAAFTVMNRTEKTRKVKVTVVGTGNLKKGKNGLLLVKEVELKPYKRELIKFKVEAGSVKESRKVEYGEASFMVKAEDKIDQDVIYHKVLVHKRRSLLTAASYGTTEESKMVEDILLPKNVYPDVGLISVTASSTVIGMLEGAFSYLKKYPYFCWEQRLTKSVMASHYQSLKKYIDTDKLPWDESETLPSQTIADSRNFQAPNGGMVYYIPQDQYVSPYLSAYTALAFHWLKKSGYDIPEEIEEKLHNYLLKMLRRNVFPTFFTEGMSSTVRSVALAALALEKKITAQDILRYQKHFKDMSLFGKAHYLQAAVTIGGNILGPVMKMASDNILSSGNITAGKYIFNESFDDGLYRILASPLRSNCSILSTFIKYLDKSKTNIAIQDVPFKMIQYLIQSRNKRDHWENTQENMFCMNALVDYSRKYETVTPNFTVNAKFAGNKIGGGKFENFKDSMQVYDYPFKKKYIGKKKKVEITKTGKGRLYYTTRISYAPRQKFIKRHNAGIDIRKELHVERSGKWEKLKLPFKIKKGELVKADIFISVPTARNFVVINDPIPGGLEPINKDLATSSKIDSDKGEFLGSTSSWFFKFSDWRFYGVSRWSFYHKELRHNAVVFYSEYLPPGNYHVSYTAQAIATGNFTSQPVHAEEMYNPDVFGKGLSSKLEVNE